MSTQFYQDSIFWVEVNKIKPNPFQPRREFDEEQLQSLADSIRQYGVLQALVVTRKEVPKEDGGLTVEYELVSGERRLRAASKAGIQQVPVLIKTGEETDLMKLELAIIENLQREDLNVVERARAFDRLVKEFKLSHNQVAKKVGKSREYVSNTLRILSLPEDILNALSAGELSEGHSRPLMMLSDKPEEQSTLFKEIIYKKLSVREAERIAKRIAHDKVRKKTEQSIDPELRTFEQEFSESLGTRVQIEKREVGGRLSIDFFSSEDLKTLLEAIRANRPTNSQATMLERYIAKQQADLERQTDANSTEPSEQTYSRSDQDHQTNQPTFQSSAAEPEARQADPGPSQTSVASIGNETTLQNQPPEPNGYRQPSEPDSNRTESDEQPAQPAPNPDNQTPFNQPQTATEANPNPPASQQPVSETDRTYQDPEQNDPEPVRPSTDRSSDPGTEHELPSDQPTNSAYRPDHDQTDQTGNPNREAAQQFTTPDSPAEDVSNNSQPDQIENAQDQETDHKTSAEEDIYSIRNFTI